MATTAQTISVPLRETLTRALRGEPAAWPAVSPDEISAFLAETRESGVQPLLRHNLTATGDWTTWPEAVREAIDERAIHDGLVAELRRAEVACVLDLLAERGVAALVMKGVALAHTHYPKQGLRPACDADLLVPPGQLDAARSVLGELGYTSRKAFTFEESFFRFDRAGMRHAVDCHWAISDVETFSREFTFEELFDRSVAVPALGPNGRALGAVDALLLACFHIAQHGEWDRLIWLYDVHLLLESLDDAGMDEFLAEARTKRCRAVCAKAVSLAVAHFGTKVDERRLGDLASLRLPLARLREPSAWSVDPDRRVLNRALAHFHDARGWRGRIGYARSLVFPSSAHLRAIYGDVSPAAVPFLHVHRWYRCLVDYVVRK